MVMRKVGKYEVGRTIGEGTFAKVKFAQNTETGESVAMKVLDRQTVLKHKMVEQVGFGVSDFRVSVSLSCLVNRIGKKVVVVVFFFSEFVGDCRKLNDPCGFLVLDGSSLDAVVNHKHLKIT